MCLKRQYHKRFLVRRTQLIARSLSALVLETGKQTNIQLRVGKLDNYTGVHSCLRNPSDRTLTAAGRHCVGTVAETRPTAAGRHCAGPVAETRADGGRKWLRRVGGGNAC